MDTPSQSTDDIPLQNDFSTKLVFCSHEFPCDDLQGLFRCLHNHSKEANFPLLAMFLAESTAVLRAETLKLPQQQRDILPHFQSILNLAVLLSELKHGPLGVAIEGALLCVLEIGMLIGHYEGQNLDYDLPQNSTSVSGLSIGLFSAAAISVSSSLSELAYVGAESVRIAFRFCVHVDQVSQLIEPRGADGILKSWAYVVTGVTVEDVQKELDEYNSAKLSPELTKVRISHADKRSVGVTGPPSRLKDLFQYSHVLRHSKHSPLAIYGGLCHATGVYGEEDVNAIMKGLNAKRCGPRLTNLPLLSPHTGVPFLAHNAGHLFELICREALTKPLYQDNLISGILTSISRAPECQILLFRTSIISNVLMSEIESNLPTLNLIRHDLIDWADKEFGSTPLSTKSSKLAVVGMSCRMPGGANDTELFWKLMVEGRDVHTKIPGDRFDLDTHYDPSGKTENSTETPFGNFIENPGLFDASFFNMSPREAEQTDPMHRLALVTAYEALEMAGFSPNRTPSTNLKRIGTFYGIASDDYREVNAGQIISTYGIPGGERAFANGRINYFFKFGGPSFNIDTACSSGGAAINAACSSLWSNEADTVVAGGLNIISNPDIYCMLSKGHFLSKTGQCKVWDKAADGYCRADGIGSVVIKRLEDAEADNDNIIGVIIAAATNHSAEAISITHPHAGAQRYNYNQVMQSAGVSPLDVSYIELHGTGTQAGDGVESESVASVFAPITPPRHADQRLHLGAVKSNIGHGEAAAGVASLIKVLLAYQNNQIPRNIGIQTEINPVVAKNIEKRNMGMVLENIAWPRRSGRKRYAIANSFGAHGGNTTFLLEESPQKMRIGEDPRSAYPVTLSAKSKFSLKGNIEALVRYLDKNPETNLGDLSYTTCARRIHHHTRIAASVTNTAQLRKFLESSIHNVDSLRPVPGKTPAVAFAFTGQGAFYDGVGSQVFREFPPYRKEILRLDKIVQQFGFPSIIPAIEGGSADCSSPLVTQLTIVVTEIALVKLWELMGIKPSVVIGHSLGEYAAMVAAGVLSAVDAIFLAGKRVELLLLTCNANTHAMLSVRASVENIEKLSGGYSYEVACMNGEADTVISGIREQIELARASLVSNGLKCVLLDIPFAFHSAQLDPMLDSFEEIAKHVFFKPPSIPVIAPLLGRCIFDSKTINANYLRRASREPVDFVGALKAARDMGIVDDWTVWNDIGPHPVCRSFVRSHAPTAKVFPSLRQNEDNSITIAGTLAGLHCEGFPVCWNEYFRPYERAHNLLHLSQYRWNEKDYWIPYVGTWTLDKAYPKEVSCNPLKICPQYGSSLNSSSIQQIISEDFQDSTGRLTAISDVMQSELLGAVTGHLINGHGVVSASIWADMALTLGEYLYKGLLPSTKEVHMNITDMQVLHAQIVQRDTSRPQFLQIEAKIDLVVRATAIEWYNCSEDGVRSEEAFASATVSYEDAAAWQKEWRKTSHLLNDRMESLSRMAMDLNGTVNKLSKNMVYTLFRNVVDYAEMYRGMQSVVLNGYEAFADIVLDPDRHGNWHTPPHWIDSVFQLAGFVMNGSDASNTNDFFCITPGWGEYRLAKPLEAGGKYRSYVRMFPAQDEPSVFVGDIIATQDGVVIGVCSQIKFKRVPRVLMDRLFVAPGAPRKSTSQSTPRRPVTSAPLPVAAMKRALQTASAGEPHGKRAATPGTDETPKDTQESVVEPAKGSLALNEEHGISADCLRLIARETGSDIEEFFDEVSFAELGIDSLMSLVLAEKFRTELGVEVQSSIFLECPSVKELKDYLGQCF